MQRKIPLLIFIILYGLIFPSVYADDNISDRLAENLIEKSNHILVLFQQTLDDTGKLEHDNALKIIQDNISPLINYKKITRSALGKYARKVAPEDVVTISQLFQQLLENTYANLFQKNFNGQEINITLKDTKALSQNKQLVSLDISSNNKTISIDYIFLPEDDEHLIVDIKVEGISLVANYRRQFSSILKKSDAAMLIATLDQLLAKNRS